MSKKIPEHLEVWGTKKGQDLMRSMLNGGPLSEQDNKTAIERQLSWPVQRQLPWPVDADIST